MTKSASNPGPGTGEIAFRFEGRDYTMVLDWEAIAWFERASDVSFIVIASALGGQGLPKLSHMAWLLQAGLQRHHPEVDFDTAGRMSVSEEVFAALGVASKAAMPPAEAAGGNATAPTA